MAEQTILGTSGVDTDAGSEGFQGPNPDSESLESSAVSEEHSDDTGVSSGDGEGDEGGKTTPPEPTVPESRYKDAERKITELAQQNAEFRARQAVNDELRKNREREEAGKDPWGWLDTATTDFEEDPSGTFKSTIERIMRQVGGMMTDQASYYDDQIRGLQPQALEAKRAMAALAGEKWFQEIPEANREGAALAYVRLKEKEEAGNRASGERPPAPPGGLSGGKSPGKIPKKPIPMHEDPKFQDRLRRMGGLKPKADGATLLGGAS